MEQKQTGGPVTFDDVKAALGEQDPAKTNAGALRKLLGRGSLSTIQKHLDSLRFAAVELVFEEAGEAPGAPKELVQSLWAVAWSQAQAQVNGALAHALVRVESLAAALGVAQADASAAIAAADEAQAETFAAQQVAEQAQAAQKAAQQALEQVRSQAEADAEAAVMEALKAREVAQAQAESVQAAHALEVAHFETRTATLQGQLDRLIEQLAEVKSLLPRQHQ